MSYQKVTKKFRRKTLVDEIKSILQQYPDDGQIFKEIIQNAEDAGATEVVFIYDKNDERDTLKLSDERFQKHQGPSLFAYNNARFDDEDWDGIISLGISRKVNDKMKVGRFGLGFKSVFHLTDIPCVASGSTLAYLDPSEETLDEEVSVFDLDPKKFALTKKYDDFKAFHRLGSSFWKKNNSTDGALFRFPLRQEKSSLSGICYKRQRFEKLMKKFTQEGYLTLLFLKHVCSIKIYTIEENSTVLNQVYSAKISENCRLLYEEEKEVFVDTIRTRVADKVFGIEEKLEHELELIVTSSDEDKSYNYAISELFGFTGENDEFVEMMTDEDLSYIPLIAIAYPLEDTGDPGGHIFSGLPIPLQSVSMNGMPVHVNGFFALGQDRKDLKWKTVSTDKSNDKTVNWNIHLINELLPLVYANLIKFLIRSQYHSDTVYNAWPLEQSTDPKWRMFLKRFYKIMMAIPCINVTTNKSWHLPYKVVFLRREEMTDENQFKAVDQFLTMTGMNVALAPEVITTSLKIISWVTSTLVQNKLKENQQVYKSLPITEKCLLLSYAIQGQEDLYNLVDLPLFPLVNGNYFQFQRCDNYFMLFRRHSQTSYFIPTRDHSKDLLPSVERVVDVNFFGADKEFLERLKSMCSSNNFNIVILRSPTSLITAVMESLPIHWTDSSQSVKWPDKSINNIWLSTFTKYRQLYNINFSLLERLPYILIENENCKKLMKISKSNPPMMTSNRRVEYISNNLKTFLQNCGICFVDKGMDSKESCDLTSGRYVLPADSQNLLNELNVHGTNVLNHYDADNEDLRKNLYDLIKSYHGELPQFCYDLPLFKAYMQTNYHSARKAIFIDEHDIPKVWNAKFANIVLTGNVKGLVKRMRLKTWSFEEISFCVVRNLQSLTNQQQISFFQYVLEKLSFRESSKEFMDLMSKHLRITDCSGNSKKPKDLFEKTPLMDAIFIGEKGKFPAESYAIYVRVLRRFGLKTSITLYDVNTSITAIQSLRITSISLLKKVEYMLCFIKKNDISPAFLQQVAWIPIATKHPSTYPTNLQWCGSTSQQIYLEKVGNVYIEGWEDLLGSVSYTVHSSIAESFSQCFNRKRIPSLALVLKHLNNVESSYTDTEKGAFYQITIKIYHYLSKNLSEVLKILPLEDMNIWYGNGFVSHRNIAISEVGAVRDLSPYYYVPPAEVLTILKPLLNYMRCSTLSEFDIYINVLQRLAKSTDQERLNRGWTLAFPIVKYLANNYQDACDERKSEVFVPIEAQGLQFQSLNLCLYHNFDKTVSYSISQSKNCILHREFDKEIATKLKVPNLVSKVLSGRKSNLFRAWGQSESLTLRLKKLLEDYHDGLSIIKELIQNADDAGAKQVKFLYDQRHNDNLKNYLVDTEMKEWQGPALWVYNDQQFTEKDFENIIKLNAGTKALDTSKIGKFGLGFNSVYHLTDVPSFLSGDSLVIFDPHVFYLGDAVMGKCEPGIRITTVADKNELLEFEDQFSVYNDVFGANIDHVNPFNGTLFRLPLRTQSSSAKSKIKQTAYTHREMVSLLEKFKESLSTLILFMKNVTLVEVYELNESAASPLEQKMLFSVEKNVTIISSNTKHTDILSAANEKLNQSFYNKYCEIPQVYIAETVDMTTTNEKRSSTLERWLNISTIGSKETYRFSVENKGHIPCGGISAKFEYQDGRFNIIPIDNGQMFCFLPLPIWSCIPMHINGAFAMSKDRQSLQFHSKDDKRYGADNWNELLANDISHAFYKLLVFFKELCPEASIEEFVSCFPIVPISHSYNTVSNKMLLGLIRLIVFRNYQIFPGRVNDEPTWISWYQLKCPDFLSNCNLTPTLVSFMNWYYKKIGSDYVFVNLPNRFKELLKSFEFSKELKDRYVTKTEIFEYFLSMIGSIDLNKEDRNKILDHLLNQKPSGTLQEKLKKTLCIPTCPSGALKKPSETVIKGSKVAELYSDQDGVFPDLKEKHFDFLHNIGANKDNLPWSMIVERARSFETVQSSDNVAKMHEKSKIILHLIERSDSECLESNDCESLLNSKFLKVLQKPKDNIFSTWFGSNTLFSSPNNMFLEKYKDICSCSSLLCEDRIERNTMKILKLDRLPSPEDMISQAKELARIFKERPIENESHSYKILKNLYDSLSCYTSQELTMQKLRDVAIVRTSTNELLVHSKVYFDDIKTITGFVHRIDTTVLMNEKWSNLMVAIGVQKKVTAARYQEVLQDLETFYKGKSLSKNHLEEIIHLLKHLCDVHINDIDKPKLLLPDSNGILKYFDDICYKDLIGLPEEKGLFYVHEDIPRSVVKSLQVKSLGGDLYLKRAHLIGSKWRIFGQHENLVSRIKALLEGYTETIDVFKEMIQNADDAGATEIEFILDKRQHGKETVFSEKWIPLQGASLLVVNNGKFNESNLIGIQALGDGSKKNDPLTTGKYGVGFNSVYRITDCPVLLTKVKEIGDVMAIFDPLLKYAEGATLKDPGSMVENAREVLKAYPDVMDSFLFEKNDKSDTTINTLFRLPLRTKKSDISENTIETKQVEDSFKVLESKIDYFLLFMQNISVVKLRIIDENGNRMETSHKAVHSFGTNRKKVKEFKLFTKIYAEKLGELTSLMKSERMLDRYLCIMHFRNETLERVLHWHVVEQCGFSNMKLLPSSVKDILDKNKLRLIPKGAVAKIYEEPSCENCHKLEKVQQALKSLPDVQDKNLVFCTLHLAEKTDIPLIINGNFILNNEARRTLWRRSTDLKAQWNDAILKHIIVPCYSYFLKNMAEELRGTVDLEEMEKDFDNLEYSNSMEKETESSYQKDKTKNEETVDFMKIKVDKFYKLFPSYRNINSNNADAKSITSLQSDNYWNYLAGEFYIKLSKENQSLLAVYRKRDELLFCKVREFLHYEIVLYYSSSQIKLLKILKNIGINTDTLPNHISKSFIQTGYKLNKVSPRIIREKLVQLKDDILPDILRAWKLEKTVFGNISNVETLLRYCLKDLKDIGEEDSERMSLKNLPLCVRCDDILECFSSASPIYNTEFNRLIEGKEHLFLHSTIHEIFSSFPSFKKHVNQDCLKDFTMSEFSNLLTERFSEYLKSESRILVFDEDNDLVKQGITSEWIRSVWQFILSVQNETQSKATQNGLCAQIDNNLLDIHKIEFLNEWSLVMAQSKKKNYLLKIADRKAVVNLEKSNNRDLQNVLRKIGVFEPAFNSTDENGLKTFVSPSVETQKLSIFGSIDSLNDIADALAFVYEHNSYKNDIFTADYIGEILAHLEFLLKNEESNDENNLDQKLLLKSLPLFENWNGEFTNAETKVIILPIEFPLVGLRQIETRRNVTFIKHLEKYQRVYKALDFEHYSCTDLYQIYLFQHINVLTDEELECHISHSRICNGNLQSMEASMKGLKIFRSESGERRLCSEMYDPRKQIFKITRRSREFPDQKYCTDEWLEFLKLLGLVTELDDQEFLCVARELEEEYDLKKVEEGSKLLCEELYKVNILNQDREREFFEQLNSIEFLLPYKFEPEFEKIRQSRNDLVKKICFKNSIIPEHRFLIWTTEYVLPDYATPQYYQSHDMSIKNARKDIACKLGVKRCKSQGSDSLDPKRVLENIKNITNFSENLEYQTTTCKYIKDSNLIKMYQRIFQHFYKYLTVIFENDDDNPEFFDQLDDSFQDVSCIYTGDDGRTIEIPAKVLLRDTKVLSPYLTKVHESLGIYFNTLEKIGCQRNAVSSHYVSMLREIKEKCKQGSLDPNEINLVKRAVLYLNNTLQEDSVEEIRNELYLPTVNFLKKEEVKLTNSSDCFYVDDFSIESRLQQFDKPLMLYNYGEGYDYFNKRLIKRLPVRIRPSVLSECIKETLVQPLEFVKVDSNHISSKIKNQLVHPFFQAGLMRLINHENVQTINFELLKDIKVGVLKTIQTQFTINNEPIKGSEQQKKIFVQEAETGISIYFDSKVSARGDGIYSEVTKALLRDMLKGLNGVAPQKMLAIPEMLSIAPESISNYLDSNGIRREESDEVIFTELGEQHPGDPVSKELHALLRQDLSAFCAGEYVGIDRDGNGKIFFYGIIRRLDDISDITSRVYGVQTTPDESYVEEIHSCMVYKFNREYEHDNEGGSHQTHQNNDEIASVIKFKHLVQNQNDSADESKLKSFEEITKEIKTIIDNLKDKDKKVRKATIRRLFKTWHPDKHAAKDQPLATEVFKFIQNEAKKLDEGYQSKFDRWKEETEKSQTEYETYRNEFKRNFPRGRPARHQENSKYSAGWEDCFSPPPRFTNKNPQPLEAKRWYKQAKHDFETAKQFSTGSYEWICYMTHQAVEKALKAVLISKDFESRKEDVHNLKELSEDMFPELKEEAAELEELLKSDDSMRYPSCWRYPSTPHDRYSNEMAHSAIAIASKIFQLIKEQYNN